MLASGTHLPRIDTLPLLLISLMSPMWPPAKSWPPFFIMSSRNWSPLMLPKPHLMVISAILTTKLSISLALILLCYYYSHSVSDSRLTMMRTAGGAAKKRADLNKRSFLSFFSFSNCQIYQIYCSLCHNSTGCLIWSQTWVWWA